MGEFYIRKGRNIKIKGAAEKKIVEAAFPQLVAIQPPDLKGFKPRLLVKEGDAVKVGSPVLEDKENNQIVVVAPASGKVQAINRGNKRALMEVVIDTDGQQETHQIKQYSLSEINGLSRENIIQQLLEGGVWPCLRQRPFSIIANPGDKPKSIFVHAMSTEPLALDIDFVLNGEEESFQIGLDIIKKLTDGAVHVCCAKDAQSEALSQAKNVTVHRFSGAHPTGNISTHIHYVDPINKGDIVWYIRAEDVVRVAHLFTEGAYSPSRVVAVTGEGAKERYYQNTIVGAPIAQLAGLKEDESPFGFRYITGSILSGRSVGPKGYVGYYDSQVTIIPEGGKREVLGWLSPGLNKYTFSKTFLSAFGPQKEASLDTDENGGHRAIVLNHLYDKYVTLDVITYFLLRAVISGDIEEAEKLGILECDEEDFALCTFACPSKTDVGGIIREGLELIEREG